MSRLTQSERETLKKRLVAALAPDNSEAHRKMEDAAFRAAIADFYTPAGLKRIATLPPHWLTEVQAVNVTPTGRRHYSRPRGLTPAHLPKCVPATHNLGDAAQKIVDAWADATSAAARQREALAYRVGRVVDSATTLEALLAKLPAARGILNIPDAAEPAGIAESLNTQLAARQPKPRAKKEG